MFFSVHTLGCKVNQYESAVISRAFEEYGYKIAVKGEKSDVVCINTCAVTEESVRKSCQCVRRARRENPSAVIVVCGCTAQTEPDFAEKMPEADVIIGNTGKTRLPELVGRFLETGDRVVEISEIGKEKCFEKMSADKGERTRAVLKIQDGCNNFCSYCIIPYARGRIRSKDIDEAFDEAVSLVNGENHYKEIVLTGIHLDNYGMDGKGYDLIDLLERLETIDGLCRVRLGSLEPVFITEENVEKMSHFTKLCHHFHLSLQSGCEKTLRAMNRHYTPDEYEKAVRLLKKTFDDCAVTTDVIVGFPGETEDDFAASREFVRKIGFSKVHVFPFSERHGTRAAEMTDKISEAVKAERCREMSEAGAESERKFYESLIGKTVEVLFETRKNGEACGHTSNYAEIRVKSERELCNELHEVQITSSSDDFAFGILL